MSKCETLPLISFLLMLLLEIMHFIFNFVIKETNLDKIIDSLESSPIYNLRIGGSCYDDKSIILHKWKGIYQNKYNDDKSKTEGETEIDKINGYYLCYDTKKSYIELLYNGQIISKNEKCRIGYKNCGIIDTLEQQLCIPENDNCPLYDIGIGEENDIHKNNKDYIFHKESKIYYNNENYNEPNKKIIGKLILNDGQPCYNPNKKLWKKFFDNEVEYSHTKCELEIFGKSTDDRYIERGEINYYRIYQDNLDYNIRSLINDKRKELKSNYVSLYKREFIGINRECNEKSNLSRDNYKNLKNIQKSVKSLLIIGPSFTIFVILAFYMKNNCFFYNKDLESHRICSIFIFHFFHKIPSIVFEIIFLKRIIYIDLSYDCSDKITNEIIKKENEYTEKTIIYLLINLGADLLVIFILFLFYVYISCECCFKNFYKYCCKDFCEACKRYYKRCCKSSYQKKKNNNNNSRDILNQEKKCIINEKVNYNRKINEIKKKYDLSGDKDINNTKCFVQTNIPEIQVDNKELNYNNNDGKNNIDDNIQNKKIIISNEQYLGQLSPIFQEDHSNSKL